MTGLDPPPFHARRQSRRVTLQAQPGVAEGSADGGPECVASDAMQETAPLRGGDGRVAFAGVRGDFGGVVGSGLFGVREFRLARAGVLDVVEKRLQVSGGNLGGAIGRRDVARDR